MKPDTSTDADQDAPFLCSRCLRELRAGRGEFYIVTIDATADPTPPILDEADLDRDYEREINALVAELNQPAFPEARRLTIHLCLNCYQEWIENPTGP